MANNHGGPRTPRNPAPVSGPGRLSKRTDGGPRMGNSRLPNAKYGENAQFQDIQNGAPMDAVAPVPGMPIPTPLTAPTRRPSEPITAGADFGPGPGAMAVPAQRTLTDLFTQLASTDPSGQVADMLSMVQRHNL